MPGAGGPFGRLSMVRGLLLAVVLAACGATGPAFIDSFRPTGGQWTDFLQDWVSARNWFSGFPVYADHTSSIDWHLGDVEAERRGELARVSKVIHHNAHPPTSVLLALPFSRLNYPNAVLAWNLTSLAALAASLWLIHRQRVLPVTGSTALLSLGALFLSGPLAKQVLLGQFNLVLLLLLTGTWIADRTGRPHVAGALLGAAATIKLFPVFLFVYFALRRRWKSVTTGIVSIVAVSSLTAIILGPGNYKGYFAQVLPEMPIFRSAWNNSSLPGFWSKLFDPIESRTPFLTVEPFVQSAAAARVGMIISAAVVLALTVRVAGSARTRLQSDRALAVATTAMLLLSPVAWEHYFLLLILPIGFAVRDIRHSSPFAQLVLLCSLAALWFRPLLLYKLLIPGFTDGVPTPLHTLFVLSLQCYGLIGLFAINVMQFRRIGASEVDPLRQSASTIPELEHSVCTTVG